MATKPEPGWLNRADMAASLGITPPTLDSWGIPSVAKIGRQKFFTCKDAAEVMIKRAQSADHKKGRIGGNPLDEEEQVIDDPFKRIQAEKMQEEIRRLQNQNNILEGRSAPVDLIREVLTKILGRVGAALDSLPLNLKRQFPELEDRQIEMIRAEVVRHQNEAANADRYLNELVEDVISEAESRIN